MTESCVARSHAGWLGVDNLLRLHPVRFCFCSFVADVGFGLCCSGTQAQHAGTPQIIAAASGRFHAVILQDASDHVPRVSDQFIAYTSDTDLAILLNRDTLEPNAAVVAIHEASTSTDTWCMVVLVVR